jgi:outer membrane murein-binding lipoprotein Lpp
VSHKFTALVAAGALAVVSGARPAAAQGASAQELAELSAQLQTLQQKIEQLEQKQAEQTETQERALDTLAKTRANVGEWVGRFTWKGDLRYRNEQFDVETVPRDRIRDRIRVRGGFVAKVNDTWSAEVQLATGGTDPRSSNQTLDGVNSRKDFELDLGYVQWKPNALWQLTLGKQKQPWARPGQSLFFDGDINPEGIAANFAHPSGVFASSFFFWLQERNAAADSNLFGAQIGWRSASTAPVRFTIGAGYYDYGAVEGYALLSPSAFSAFGNTILRRSGTGVPPAELARAAAVCRGTAAAVPQCLASDYNIAQIFGEVALTVGGYPLAFFADYGQNGDVDDEDTAYGVGVTLGRISAPRTWELGYMYQELEKDSLLGQFVDSDFGDGNTDTKGSVFRFGYGFARNFNFNATYFLNDLNVSGLSGGLRGREYKRLQLDLNYRF